MFIELLEKRQNIFKPGNLVRSKYEFWGHVIVISYTDKFLSGIENRYQEQETFVYINEKIHPENWVLINLC